MLVLERVVGFTLWISDIFGVNGLPRVNMVLYNCAGFSVLYRVSYQSIPQMC